MTIDIEDACYGDLTLMSSNDEMSPNVFYVSGGDNVVLCEIGRHILLSSTKIGRAYTGEVEGFDVENGTILLYGWGHKKVSNFEYFASMPRF